MTKRYLLANMILQCQSDMSWNPANHDEIIHYTKWYLTVVVSGMLLTFFKRSPLVAFVYEHGCEENAYTFNNLINLTSLHGQITFEKLPLFIVYSSYICRMYCTLSSQYFGNANLRKMQI